MEKNKKYVSKPNKKSAVALTFKIIALLLIIAAFTFCLVWTITNWDSVKNITNGANIATQEDVDKAFKDGYNQGIIDKENYTSQINDFKEKYENEKDKNSQLQKENADKEALLKKQYEEKLADIQKQLQEKMDKISILNSQLEAKDQSNAKLTEKVGELQNKITSLTNDNADKATTINQLKNQISDLKAELNSNLVDKNEFDATIEAYKRQIAELEASLKIYEDYYNQAQENQVIVTFKIGDQVYNLQTITKGNAPQAVTDPETNDHFVFNGWLLNGTRVNPTECTLNENTTFIADVTYKYDVNYYDETTVVKTEIIEAGQNATGHTIADTEGKIFEGWSLDGTTLVDPTTTTITANTNFYAVFTYKYKVTILNNGSEYYTELVAAGDSPTLSDFVMPSTGNVSTKNIGFSTNGVDILTIADIKNLTISANSIFTLVSKERETVKLTDTGKGAPSNSGGYMAKEKIDGDSKCNLINLLGYNEDKIRNNGTYDYRYYYAIKNAKIFLSYGQLKLEDGSTIFFDKEYMAELQAIELSEDNDVVTFNIDTTKDCYKDGKVVGTIDINLSIEFKLVQSTSESPYLHWEVKNSNVNFTSYYFNISTSSYAEVYLNN